MDAGKLVTMLNQIAAFHRRLPPDQAANEVAAHVEKFWEKRMRQAADAHLEAGGVGLDGNAAAALRLLRTRVPQPAHLDPPLEA